MIKLVFALAIVLVVSLVPERTVAEDKAILEAVKKSVDALDRAFATKDREAMKKLIAPDHVAVTPSTGHPLNAQEELDVLAKIKINALSIGDKKFSVLGPRTVLLEQEKSYSGTYEGKPLPKHIFSTAVWIKRDGQWRERLYQETAIAGR